VSQLPLDLGHRPASGREDFLVAPCNEAAVAWLDRWPRWSAPALVLCGPAGCGKTHLVQVFRARSGACLLDPGTLSVANLPSRLGDARAAIIDPAQAMPEQALFHLYNLLAERGGHLVLTAREPPARWTIALADLRSRLLAAALAEVAAPDEALIAALLIKLFADRQIEIGEDVIAYLVPRLERSFDAAQSAVALLDRAALAAQRRITVPLARGALGWQG
jgi:DnaA regulatory inactivator Hda